MNLHLVHGAWECVITDQEYGSWELGEDILIVVGS